MHDRIARWCATQRRLLNAERAETRKSHDSDVSFRGVVDQMENRDCGTTAVTFSVLKGSAQKLGLMKERSFVKVLPIGTDGQIPPNGRGKWISGTLKSKAADSFTISFKVNCAKNAMCVDTAVAVTSGENEITFQRLFDTLDVVEKALQDGDLMAHALFMFRILFKEVSGDTPDIRSLSVSPTMLSAETAVPLNESQRFAVKAALESSDFYMIHGPPGTGKTSTICDIVRQSLKSGKRVLLCAPSNCAVDNAVLKIIQAHCIPKGTELLRFGDTDRMNPQLLACSLDSVVHSRDEYELIEQIEKEIKIAEKKSRYREKNTLYTEKKRRLRSLKAACVASARIVACTLNSAGHKVFDGEIFDTCVIDEAGQALAVESCIAISKAHKVILVGDPMQLPPVTLSNHAELEVSLMESILKTHAGHFTVLDVQYRMHDIISRWSSGEFYCNKLRSDPAVESLLLSDIDGTTETYETSQAIMFCDTSDYGFREYTERGSTSKMNMGEVGIVVDHILRLVDAGVPAEDIGVITPYSAQAAHIRRELKGMNVEHGKIEVNTVDAFQGREKLVIIISLVRNNEEHEIGFLGESRRLNVAMTRARRHLLVIGDVKTSSASEFMARFWNFIEENGAFVDLDH